MHYKMYVIQYYVYIYILVSQAFTQSPTGRLHIHMSSQVLSTVSAALEALPSEEELQREASGAPELHGTLAAKVLLGERLALETCIGQWS